MRKKVEKCGICEEPFDFDEDKDPIGVVMTEYLVPNDFLKKFGGRI